jgi:hypothetical protein
LSVDAQEIRIVSPPVEFQLNLTEGTPAGYLVYRVEAVLGTMGDSMEGDLLHYLLEVSFFGNWRLGKKRKNGENCEFSIQFSEMVKNGKIAFCEKRQIFAKKCKRWANLEIF